MKAPFGCTLAENALVVDHHGSYLPCCRFLGSSPIGYGKDQKGTKSILNENFFTNLREKLNDGVFPPGCADCKKDEVHGLQSLRMKRRGVFKAPVGNLVDLELFVGSLCNMKCRMCNHNYSSLWAKEVGESLNTGYDPLKVLKSCNLTSLQHLRLLGGETLINKDFFRVLDYLIEHSEPSKITLSFATNGSSGINGKLKEYLKNFKRVEVDFSVDAIGSLAEYIRPGIPWVEVDKNIKSWIQYKNQQECNWNLNVHTTIQALNVQSVFEIVEFCIANQLTWSHRVLTDPHELSWLRIPFDVRESVCLKNKKEFSNSGLKNFFDNHESYPLYEILTETFPKLELQPEKTLIDYLEHWDSKWGVSWRTVLPEVWEKSLTN